MTYLSGQVRRSLQGRDGTEPLSAMDASTVTDMKYAPSSDVKDVSSSDTDTKSGDESEAKVVTASKSKIDQFFGAEPSSESRDLDQTVTAVTKYVE